MDRKFSRLSKQDKVLLGGGYLLLGIFVLLIIIPLVFVVIASFMDPNVLNNQGITFDFSKWSLGGYKRVFENQMIWRGFFNSMVYSISFAVFSVFITLLAAYPLSKKDFVGKKIYQYHLSDYNVLWRWINADIFISQQPESD